MKTKLRSYLPIWFIVMVPPTILLLFGYNFIFCSFALIFALISIKDDDAFDKYTKCIGRLWGISFLLDLIGLALLIVPEFFSKIKFINDNLVYPLEHNPYTKVLSFIYMILVFAILYFIGYKLIKKFIIKRIRKKEDLGRRITIVMTLFIVPYLFFVPTTMFEKTSKSSLEDFKGTLLQKNSDIVNLVKFLNVSEFITTYHLDITVQPYTLKFNVKDLDTNAYLYFEQDASIIFNLISNVNEVVFTLDDKDYVYKINDINKIFKDIKSKSLNDISSYYKDSKFKDYIYYGFIKDYTVFDTSEYCLEEKQLLFKDDNYNYYFKCTDLSKIMLYSKDEEYTLKDALDKKVITKEEVLNSNLTIIKEEISESTSK